MALTTSSKRDVHLHLGGRSCRKRELCAEPCKRYRREATVLHIPPLSHPFLTSTLEKLCHTIGTLDRAISTSYTALFLRLTPRTQLPTMFAPRVFTSSSRQCLRKACQQPTWTPAVYQVSSRKASSALSTRANTTSRLDPTLPLQRRIRSPNSREREVQMESTLFL